ncbi:MAG: hypothetical protein MN733_13065, partial [Nitrososphaera sp.]|nr:hypothetical protein [Nitrososphaera sp.]
DWRMKSLLRSAGESPLAAKGGRAIPFASLRGIATRFACSKSGIRGVGRALRYCGIFADTGTGGDGGNGSESYGQLQEIFHSS